MPVETQITSVKTPVETLKTPVETPNTPVKTPVETPSTPVKTPVKALVTPVKTPVKTMSTPGETPVKTHEAILGVLKDDGFLTLAEVASRIGKSVRAVERATKKLRDQGKLKYIGSAKSGHWKVYK